MRWGGVLALKGGASGARRLGGPGAAGGIMARAAG